MIKVRVGGLIYNICMGKKRFMSLRGFLAPKMAKKSIFFAGKESSDSATTDSETLGVCGE